MYTWILISSINTLWMMTSPNGNIFRVTDPLCGEFTGHPGIPSQRPVTRSFDVFFDLYLNKRLSKQQRRRWLEMPSCSLWRRCNGYRDDHCSMCNVLKSKISLCFNFVNLFNTVREGTECNWSNLSKHIPYHTQTSKCNMHLQRFNVVYKRGFIHITLYRQVCQLSLISQYPISAVLEQTTIFRILHYFMMTTSNGNIFRVTGPLCGEFNGRRWIPITITSDAELWCFIWSAPE